MKTALLSTLPAGISPDWVDVLILDEDGNELPPDNVGQLVIRSEYLSPGYWRRDSETAQMRRSRERRALVSSG